MELIFERYVNRLQRLQRAPGSIRNAELVLGRFEDYCATQNESVLTVRSGLIEEWLATEGLAPSTQKSWHAILRAAYRYAQSQGWREDVPTRDALIAREPDREPRVIPNEELRAMKERAWQPRSQILYHLLVYTGARRSELCGLRGDAIVGDTLRIEGKGGKARLTPIHPALGEVLQHHSGPGPLLYGPHGLPIKESRVYTLTKEWAGDYTPHDFRRTLATSLAENGVADAIIEKMLGWAPRSVMGRFYRRVSDEECQRAILAAYANDPL